MSLSAYNSCSGESQTLFRAGRLLQQFLVDASACIEEDRLNWMRHYQRQLLAELYSGLRDAIRQAGLMPDSIGRMTDAMAICRSMGHPDLFLTFTCNPKWPEVQYFIETLEGQKSDDRIDVVIRVFSIKLWELMDDIKRRNIFGRVVAVVYTIEFQKRGLPHAHRLVFLHAEDKIQTASRIDEIISAEIPNKEEDPAAYNIVEKFMVHGPCGILNRNSPCMVKDYCANHFPKKFHAKTTMDEGAFRIYMRRNDGRYIIKNDTQLDNRYVVPYSRNLLVKFDAHLNVELCNRSMSLKYLFKNVKKGPIRFTSINSNADKADSSRMQQVNDHDEINAHLDCRYITAAEAAWRIFWFEMFYREPAVERLSFHLPDQQIIYFPEAMQVQSALHRPGTGRTMFTERMRLNSEDRKAQQLSYAEFPMKFVWNNNGKIWTRRCNGRIFYVPPTTGEMYYLCLLLNVVRGSRSYQEIRTVNGVSYPTFKEACYALGLLEDDQEWHDCLKEASTWGSGTELPQLFCAILLFCEIVDPAQLWERNWKVLSVDILYEQRKLLNFPNVNLTDEQVQNYALSEIEKILIKAGKSLEGCQGMTVPHDILMVQMNNRLISEELNYDRMRMQEEYSQMLHKLNSDQKAIHDRVLQFVDSRNGKLCVRIRWNRENISLENSPFKNQI
ncbi:uncharacterized protein LOC116206350 [Punica granatum]|uniref:Uncharacterized protein LOC116206350 n=1 Tax=Punica granatum TaxID=22663 RepID=A0A6P8DP08_PUNGR|nr:uncharacterized protein LOC116206350 [Punica granatum]